MPRFDGTGPMGLGPRTGRGLGPCGSGYCPRGLGFGRGYGRGFGFRQFSSDKNTKVALEDEKQILEEELKAINAEIEELDQ